MTKLCCLTVGLGVSSGYIQGQTIKRKHVCYEVSLSKCNVGGSKIVGKEKFTSGVGSSVGFSVDGLGATDGCLVGANEGAEEGTRDGTTDEEGCTEGASESPVGFIDSVGTEVGSAEGPELGSREGSGVPPSMLGLELVVGLRVGVPPSPVGWFDTVGPSLGLLLGATGARLGGFEILGDREIVGAGVAGGGVGATGPTLGFAVGFCTDGATAGFLCSRTQSFLFFPPRHAPPPPPAAYD